MIIRVTGGLGNQMFQYAFKKSIERKFPHINHYLDTSFYKDRDVHNGYELKRIFKIHEEEKEVSILYRRFLSKLLYPYYKCKVDFVKTPISLNETRFGYYDKMAELPAKEKYILDGYWQSEDYFVQIRDDISMSFTFPELDKRNTEFLNSKKNGYTLVSVHVRRGDFMKSSMYRDLTATDYYSKAIDIIVTKVNNPLFLIFSDDHNWCNSYFSRLENKCLVDWNKKEDSYRDMQMMSLCSHNIIANSSFSWWGAWLNNNPNKIVIAPSCFFNWESIDESHLIPKIWIKI